MILLGILVTCCFFLKGLFTFAVSAKVGLTSVPVTTSYNEPPVETVRKPVDNKSSVAAQKEIATVDITKAQAVNVDDTKTERPEQQVQHITTGLPGPLDTEKDAPHPNGSSLHTDNLANLMQGVNIFESRTSGDQENSKDETKNESFVTDTEIKYQENTTGNASITNATDMIVPGEFISFNKSHDKVTDIRTLK